MHKHITLHISPSMHCAGERGDFCFQGISASGGCLLSGVGGIPACTVCFQGVSASGGSASVHAGILPTTPRRRHAPRSRSPLSTESLTHATENITLPETSFTGGNKMVFKPTLHRVEIQMTRPVLTEVVLDLAFDQCFVDLELIFKD